LNASGNSWSSDLATNLVTISAHDRLRPTPGARIAARRGRLGAPPGPRSRGIRARRRRGAGSALDRARTTPVGRAGAGLSAWRASSASAGARRTSTKAARREPASSRTAVPTSSAWSSNAVYGGWRAGRDPPALSAVTRAVALSIQRIDRRRGWARLRPRNRSFQSSSSALHATVLTPTNMWAFDKWRCRWQLEPIDGAVRSSPTAPECQRVFEDKGGPAPPRHGLDSTLGTHARTARG